MQPAAYVQLPGGHDDHIHVRVTMEFMEMPGLRLTIRQAARLFNLDAASCERVLGALVNSGALSTAGDVFIRADSGRRRA
jgi:hypothetical protein